MTTQYAEEQGFKKKYLAPLIVLMLCAVSLTGAAYAYSTSVTGHGDIDGDYISIDMYKDSAAGTVLTENLTSKHFQVYTEREVASTVTYNAYVEEGQLIYTTYVKVSTNLGNTSEYKFNGTGAYKAATLESGTVGTLIIKNVTNDGKDAKIDDLTKFMAVEDKDGNAVALNADGTFHIKGETVYKVTFTFDIGQDGANVFGTFTGATALADLKAAVAAFDVAGVGFTFALNAEYIAPSA